MRKSDRSLRHKATPRRLVFLTGVALLAVACAVRAPVEPEPAAGETKPPTVDHQTATRYVVDTESSELRLYVYRAGPLARLGHNHVIATRELSGTVWHRDGSGRSAFSVGFPAESLQVDEPELRREAGADFPGEISAEDIAGTRENLLGERVLDAANHPGITAELVRAAGEPPAVTLTCAVTIRGQRRLVDFPGRLEVRDDRLIADGETTVTHGQLGLSPYSVMGGALSVADEIRIVWHIEAVQAER